MFVVGSSENTNSWRYNIATGRMMVRHGHNWATVQTSLVCFVAPEGTLGGFLKSSPTKLLHNSLQSMSGQEMCNLQHMTWKLKFLAAKEYMFTFHANERYTDLNLQYMSCLAVC